MSEITLAGLDGANPLGFLAALGVLRVLSRTELARNARMNWASQNGRWNPVIELADVLQESELPGCLVRACQALYCREALALGDDLTVSKETYRAYMLSAAMSASPHEPVLAEFAACLATDVLETDSGVVQDTAFRTMSGAGHQHFLGTMRSLVSATTEEHLRDALLSPWEYRDPIQGMSLRWDPSDDIRYALRWADPSGDPERQKRGTVWGANRLAIEGLPLLPVMPSGSQLRTTGFTSRGARATYWTWPIWTVPATLDSVRSLLALAVLQDESPDRHKLAARGIAEVFRAQRLTVGKFRTFGRGVPFELARGFRAD